MNSHAPKRILLGEMGAKGRLAGSLWQDQEEHGGQAGEVGSGRLD